MHFLTVSEKTASCGSRMASALHFQYQTVADVRLYCQVGQTPCGSADERAAWALRSAWRGLSRASLTGRSALASAAVHSRSSRCDMWQHQ